MSADDIETIATRLDAVSDAGTDLKQLLEVLHDAAANVESQLGDVTDLLSELGPDVATAAEEGLALQEQIVELREALVEYDGRQGTTDNTDTLQEAIDLVRGLDSDEVVVEDAELVDKLSTALSRYTSATDMRDADDVLTEAIKAIEGLPLMLDTELLDRLQGALQCADHPAGSDKNSVLANACAFIESCIP